MKKILVIIDFSPATDDIMDFSLMLAEKMNASLLILNVIDFMEKMVGLRSVNKVLEEDAQDRMDRFVKSYKKKTDKKLLTKIAKGDPYTVISRQAELNSADLIILGAQGEDIDEKYFLGKVAGSVIKFSHLPVIAVPKDYKAKEINDIVFMYRKLNKSLFEVITPLFEVSKAFKAKIHSVHLTGKLSGSVAYSPELIFENHDYDHKELNENSFTEGINAFSQNYITPDFICVIKKKRGMLEHIFESSPTPKTIIDSPVPVLFLNEDES